MILLKDVKKIYGDNEFNKVEALKGVSVSFRESEFVSILGPSGCGKTTLLNILGGLDKASEGDFVYDGISTKDYKARDWDKFRNEQVSFVFQSYNLIPHLSVLSNVELALTISGMTGDEKRDKAISALSQVGLGDIGDKLPNQLSGGQMQRVAIARAIVNDTKILLADEPTGAIDTETSKQIMDILKDISKTRLVIMVTHNVELAREYSSRIIELSDGNVISDSSPYEPPVQEETQEVAKLDAQIGKTELRKTAKKNKRFSALNFKTALKISLGNLIHKRGRSILTTIAGSIGIICIALILAVNNGFSTYINDFELKSLSKYPISVSAGTVSARDRLIELMTQGGLKGGQSLDTLFDIIADKNNPSEMFTDEDVIRIQKQITAVMAIMQEQEAKPADISRFKKYVEQNFDYSLATVKYDYSVSMDIFVRAEEEYHQISPIAKSHTFAPFVEMMGETGEGMDVLNSFTFWDEILADNDVLTSQYSILAGSLPKNKNEIVLVLDECNQISDFEALMLEELGFSDLLSLVLYNKDVSKYDMVFADMLGKEYYILPTSAAYAYDEESGKFSHATGGDDIEAAIEQGGIKVTISGILRNKEGVEGCINGVVGYTSALSDYIIGDANNCALATALKASYEKYIVDMAEFQKQLETGLITMLPPQIINPLTGDAISEDDCKALLFEMNVRDLDAPTSIYFYPNAVASKNNIVGFIEDYNAIIADEVKEAELDLVPVTHDYSVGYVDSLDGTVNELHELANTITYILIGVGSVSLIVTMLLIAIIMYIAVQDRTREIGILRSLGASKFDISKIFNVETVVIGLVSGIIGVLAAFILQFPGNLIFKSTMNMSALKMAWWHPILLIFGSVLITFIAGLIPASIASKKEPVVALRME